MHQAGITIDVINVQIDIKRSERARLLFQLSPERGNGV